MFGQAMNFKNAYNDVSVQHEVLGSSPQQLIEMLFDGAIRRIQDAKFHLQHGNIQAKAEAITHACDIIERGLRSSLDLEKGGELAQSLDDLYEYIDLRLLAGHARNDTVPLDEAIKLLGELADAWRELGHQVRTPASASASNTA